VSGEGVVVVGPFGDQGPQGRIGGEDAAVLPGQHILGLVGFQKAVAGKVAKRPPPDPVLEALKEFVGEGCGFVETEAGFWIGRILIRVIRDPLEKPVHEAPSGLTE
jgi:hypothetical protein